MSKNFINGNFAIDNINVAGTSDPIGTTWLAGTRVTDTTTGNIYIVITSTTPGDTLTTLIAGGKVLAVPTSADITSAVAAEAVARDVAIAAAIAPTEPDIKVVTGTIPAIDADTRVVVEVNLGELTNKTRAVLTFFASTAVDGYISDGIIEGVLLFSEGVRAPLGLPKFINEVSDHTKYFLTVYEDYLQTRKHTSVTASATAVNYDAGTRLPPGITYEGIGVGVLGGWYSANNHGVFDLDKKVQCESAWLTQSGDNTLLHLALKNVDVSANTTKDIKIGVYE